MTDDTQPTRFYIESLVPVYRPGTMTPPHGLDSDTVDAWVPVGSIEVEPPGEYGPSLRDAFTAWESEQEPPPPVGSYRVWQHHSYGLSAVVFEITERVERDIRRVEGPAEQQLRADLTVASVAAMTKAEGGEAA